MKNITIAYLLLFALSYSNHIYSQKIFTFFDEFYMVDNNEYKFSQLGQFMKKDESLFKAYQTANSNHKAAEMSKKTFVAAIFIGLTVMTISSDEGSCDFCISEVQSLGLLTLLGVAPLAGITSLILSPQSKRERLSVIADYNSLYSTSNIDLNQRDVQLVLSYTGSGIGFTLLF